MSAAKRWASVVPMSSCEGRQPWTWIWTLQSSRGGRRGRGGSARAMADRVMQAVKLQPDRLIALHHAMASVRRGGTLSVTGVCA